jgi:RNA polymerase sigma-70 factor (ECF subfamily)
MQQQTRGQQFMTMVQPHLDGLFSSAMRMTGGRSDAEDLVQEALLHAYQAWDRFEPGTNLRAWLHRILVNGYISGYRRRVRERRALDVEGDPSRRDLLLSSAQCEVETADGGVHVRGLGRVLQRALDELPAEFRAVVILADLAELSYKEIADALHCPIGTVMSRLHRGRRALARRMGPVLGVSVNEETEMPVEANAA